MRIIIRASVAGFQLTIPLGTLRLPAGPAAPRHDVSRRRPSTRRLSSIQHGHALPAGKAPQRGGPAGVLLQADQRAAPQLALLRRQLEAGSSGLGGRGAGTESAGATLVRDSPVLGSERPLEVLRLTAEQPDDAFLLRWLRSRDGDADAAEAGVRAHAAWRGQHVQTGGISEVRRATST